MIGGYITHVQSDTPWGTLYGILVPTTSILLVCSDLSYLQTCRPVVGTGIVGAGGGESIANSIAGGGAVIREEGWSFHVWNWSQFLIFPKFCSFKPPHN